METDMPEIREKWEEIKEYIKNEYEINPVSYKTWILPLKLYDVVDNKVYILIPSENSQALNYLNSKYLNIFRVTISEMFEDSLQSVNDLKFMVFLSILHLE